MCTANEYKMKQDTGGRTTEQQGNIAVKYEILVAKIVFGKIFVVTNSLNSF